ncbi:MAG: tryptophan synthase subunit alpha [Gammaproteobacteria bacterium]|nr:MAG: tryptophan synthase subunit alpha [Gammaproteobacteria bacterium]
MNRIVTRLDALRAAGKKAGTTAIVAYVTAGHPHPDMTVGIMHELVAAGADLLELGVPFSDPMADGPVIQRACETALGHGVSSGTVFKMLRRFRERDVTTPVILMGYLNPIETMGTGAFAARAAEAGADGVLVVDCPPEESGELNAALKAKELCQIYLLSPTTTDDRVRLIAGQGSGFLYYVALTGVTGADSLIPDTVVARVQQIRGMTDLPVGVGFGIKDAESAVVLAAGADLIIVGSALVARLGERGDPEAVKAAAALVSEIRAGLDAPSVAGERGVL